jgi:hypothetical protein
MDNVILIEGGIIIFFGVAYVLQKSKPVTPVFVGAVGLLLIVSLLEVFGGVAAELGKGLLSLATFSVVIAEGGSLLAGVQSSLKKTGA